MVKDYLWSSCYSDSGHKRENSLAEKVINAKLHGLTMEKRHLSKMNTMSGSSKTECLIRSTSFSLRLKEEAKRAALLAKAASIEHKKAITLKEAALAIEKEECLIQTALAISDAKRQVYQRHDYCCEPPAKRVDRTTVNLPSIPACTPAPVNAACHIEMDKLQEQTALTTVVSENQITVASNGAGGNSIAAIGLSRLMSIVGQEVMETCAFLDSGNSACDVEHEVDFSQFYWGEEMEKAANKKKEVEQNLKEKDVEMDKADDPCSNHTNMINKNTQLHQENLTYSAKMSTTGKMDTDTFFKLKQEPSVERSRWRRLQETFLNSEHVQQQRRVQVHDSDQWKTYDPGGLSPISCL